VNAYDGQQDIELEARCTDLYQQIMAGFDSLPRATWTAEYRIAIRAIQAQEIEFRAICTELRRRIEERAARWDEITDVAIEAIIEASSGESQAAPRGLASCGHPADEDGECGCSSWPERARDL
jgi:hypothetical protein